MSIKTFIRQHRKEIDVAISQRLTEYDKPGFVRGIPYMNDENRREWVLNDEGLYKWARAEGVKI